MLGQRRRGAADRGLRRPASRRSSPPTAARWRARCAWPARSTRCSSTTSPRCPQAIFEQARDGDVVIAMGAGSIGARAAREDWCEAGQTRRARRRRRCSATIDAKALGKVAVLMGGSSAEREISLMSGGGVLAALQSPGRRRARLRPGRARPRRAQARRLRSAASSRCTAATARTARCRARSSCSAFPYTGSRRDGLARSRMDKVMTKRVWLRRGPADAALGAPGRRRAGARAHAHGARRARPAADRQAAARRLVDRRHQGAAATRRCRTRWRSPRATTPTCCARSSSTATK